VADEDLTFSDETLTQHSISPCLMDPFQSLPTASNNFSLLFISFTWQG
jgi:hypothetical protein